MGKVSKWFKKLLGFKKTTNSSYSSSINQHTNPKRANKSPKKEWDFVKSDLDKDYQYDKSRYYGVSTPLNHGLDEAGVDPPTNSIVHSPVTTNSTARTPTVTTWNSVVFTHKQWAAIVIQSRFRAYLSRRALRALKGLVKLQALVRGHIVRKQTADMLRRMQALIRAQSRARAGRFQAFESPYLSAKSIQFLHHGPATPDKFEHVIRARSMKNDHTFMLKRNSSKSTTPTKVVYPQKIDKIFDIDGGKPNVNPKQRNLFHSTDLSLNSDQFSFSLDETCFSSTDNSPQLDSVSSKGGRLRRGPLTPTKSIDGTRSCLSGYSDCPNYMSYTAAAKAKTRSMSAPKLRPKYDTLSSTKRYSIHGHGEPRANLQKGSAYYSNFTSKAYPGSGRLDKLGMPVRRDSEEFIHGAWNIY